MAARNAKTTGDTTSAAPKASEKKQDVKETQTATKAATKPTTTKTPASNEEESAAMSTTGQEQSETETKHSIKLIANVYSDDGIISAGNNKLTRAQIEVCHEAGAIDPDWLAAEERAAAVFQEKMNSQD